MASIPSGDYSRGAAGFWVENGVIAYPVEEITIAGNCATCSSRMVPGHGYPVAWRQGHGFGADRIHDGGWRGLAPAFATLLRYGQVLRIGLTGVPFLSKWLAGSYS
jgi:hypothetical protein